MRAQRVGGQVGNRERDDPLVIDMGIAGQTLFQQPVVFVDRDIQRSERGIALTGGEERTAMFDLVESRPVSCRPERDCQANLLYFLHGNAQGCGGVGSSASEFDSEAQHRKLSSAFG
jgi:hypothetical protein